MKKITEDAIEAFYNNKPFFRNNTEVYVNNEEVTLFLFGSPIIKKTLPDNKITIDTYGYFSNTTLERLNALKEISIRRKPKSENTFILFLKEFNVNIEWDGSKININ